MNNILTKNFIENIKRDFFINIFFSIISVLLFLSSCYVLSSFIEMKNKQYNKNYGAVKIYKNEDNLFLFNKDPDYNVVLVKDEIKRLYKDYKLIESVISFPVSIVLKTASSEAKVYSYESGVLENGYSMSDILISGKVFSTNNNEIIVGKYLSEAIGIKEGDIVSLLARVSLGSLETRYFTVSGIYDFDKYNYDIFTDIQSASNFLHFRDGDKSPYNESIILFGDAKKMEKAFNNYQTLASFNIEPLNIERELFIKEYLLNTGVIIFYLILIFSSSFLISALNNIRCQKNYNNIKCKYVLQTVAFGLFGIILSLLIAVFAYMDKIIIFYGLFSVIAAFTISMLIMPYRNYIK